MRKHEDTHARTTLGVEWSGRFLTHSVFCRHGQVLYGCYFLFVAIFYKLVSSLRMGQGRDTVPHVRDLAMSPTIFSVFSIGNVFLRSHGLPTVSIPKGLRGGRSGARCLEGLDACALEEVVDGIGRIVQAFEFE